MGYSGPSACLKFVVGVFGKSGIGGTGSNKYTELMLTADDSAIPTRARAHIRPIGWIIDKWYFHNRSI